MVSIRSNIYPSQTDNQRIQPHGTQAIDGDTQTISGDALFERQLTLRKQRIEGRLLVEARSIVVQSSPTDTAINTDCQRRKTQVLNQESTQVISYGNNKPKPKGHATTTFQQVSTVNGHVVQLYMLDNQSKKTFIQNDAQTIKTFSTSLNMTDYLRDQNRVKGRTRAALMRLRRKIVLIR